MLVIAEIHRKLPGAKVVKGILLEAGMVSDLDRLRTSQDLWRIEQPDKHDPRSCRLIPMHDGGDNSS